MRYKINKDLKRYIEQNIFPEYQKNEAGHGIDHINNVIKHSLKFAESVKDVNYNMVYAIAAYHDITHHIDAKNHEKLSAEMLASDERLKEFFDGEQIKVMSEAVYDHRSSREGDPRSIYGKIVASADKKMSFDDPLKRTYSYRMEHFSNSTLAEICEESRQHLINKYGKSGYANKKSYFEDPDYDKFLEHIRNLASDKKKFERRYVKVNHISSLDWLTKDVRCDLKKYISDNILPEYSKNDGGHNQAHIMEVIRRSFELNKAFHLSLDPNMIYAIAACHDRGKYEDHERHHLIAAQYFINDDNFCHFFDNQQRAIIKEAIEDHRSSKEDEPRSTYGKLISSADRNSRIDIVFVRSFFVAHERMPDAVISDYLDYTIERLSKKYSETNPENMFYEDRIYKSFLRKMRNLLKNETEFKDRYCSVNHISSRQNLVKDEPGAIEFLQGY